MKEYRKEIESLSSWKRALAGTTYPLDREYTAQALGFDGPTLNSMDSVADRDYLIDFCPIYP